MKSKKCMGKKGARRPIEFGLLIIRLSQFSRLKTVRRRPYGKPRGPGSSVPSEHSHSPAAKARSTRIEQLVCHGRRRIKLPLSIVAKQPMVKEDDEEFLTLPGCGTDFISAKGFCGYFASSACSTLPWKHGNSHPPIFGRF